MPGTRPRPFDATWTDCGCLLDVRSPGPPQSTLMAFPSVTWNKGSASPGHLHCQRGPSEWKKLLFASFATNISSCVSVNPIEIRIAIFVLQQNNRWEKFSSVFTDPIVVRIVGKILLVTFSSIGLKFAIANFYLFSIKGQSGKFQLHFHQPD